MRSYASLPLRTSLRGLVALVAASLFAATPAAWQTGRSPRGVERPASPPERALAAGQAVSSGVGTARGPLERATSVSASVVGRATLPDGTPLPGAWVRTNLGLADTSAADGSFLLEGSLPVGAPLVVQVEGTLGGARYAGTAGSLVPLSPGVSDVGELVANPGAFRPLFPEPELFVASLERSVASADLELDGDLDLVVASLGGVVSVLRNDGTGSFGPAEEILTNSGPLWVETGDLDADGDVDLAVANSGGAAVGTVSILLNEGDGTFAPPVAYPATQFQDVVLVGDVDGDRDLDLVTGHRSPFSDELTLLRNAGDGTFGAAESFRVGDHRGFALFDAEGDGDLDLAVLLVPSGLLVLRNDGGGTFAPTATVPSLNRPERVLAADLDGDQELDLVYASYAASTLVVRAGDGEGGFAPEVSYATGSMPRAVATGDLDGDGDLDAAVVNAGDDTVSVLANQGDGTLANQLVYAATTDPLDLDAADLDGDGAPDLAVTRFGSLAVLLNDGAGAFGAPSTYSSGFSTREVASGDLDLDGDLDLVVTNQNAGTSLAAFSLLLNAGAGTFGPNVRIGSNGSLGVTLADLDQDGRLDIVGSGGGVLVLRGLGGATFAPAVSYPTGASPRKVLARDLDFDGDLDLAVATAFFGSTVTVLRGMGDGTFGASQYHGVGSAVGLACGDLDGDRDLELVTNSTTASAGNGSLSILWNRLRRQPRIIDGVQDPFSTDE